MVTSQLCIWSGLIQKVASVKQRESQTRTGYERHIATVSQGHERSHCESVANLYTGEARIR
jgi:hypothetical protein